MNWYRSELKQRAKAVFKTAYWKLVLVGLVLGICTGGSGGSGGNAINQSLSDKKDDVLSQMDPTVLLAIIGIAAAAIVVAIIVGIIVAAFLLNPLQVGCRKFTIDVREDAGTPLSVLGFVFSNSYGNVAKTMFLRDLYTFLWSMLLIIPGIIKSYEYRMIPYILAENPGMSAPECFAMSKEMMMGEKWKAFVLDWSFLGWYILGAFTCGILYIFYVNPYVYQTDAELYAVLKQKVMPVQPAAEASYGYNDGFSGSGYNM